MIWKPAVLGTGDFNKWDCPVNFSHERKVLEDHYARGEPLIIVRSGPTLSSGSFEPGELGAISWEGNLVVRRCGLGHEGCRAKHPIGPRLPPDYKSGRGVKVHKKKGEDRYEHNKPNKY